jgi:excisionase family DNA binding protein
MLLMLTVDEAARRVRRHPETIRRWIWSGRLRSTRIGNRHLISESDLEQLSSGHAEPGKGLGTWLDELYRLHDETRFRHRGVPPGAELIRAERDAH